MGGKDVFYGFASAKNTMFLKLFRSNGKEGTLSTDQLMRPGSLQQSRQSFPRAPEGAVMCISEVSTPRPSAGKAADLWKGEAEGEACKPSCLLCTFGYAPLGPAFFKTAHP